jgi:hypothetical protein
VPLSTLFTTPLSAWATSCAKEGCDPIAKAKATSAARNMLNRFVRKSAIVLLLDLVVNVCQLGYFMSGIYANE